MKHSDEPLFSFNSFNSVTLRTNETIRVVQQLDLSTGQWFFWVEVLDEHGKVKDRSLKEKLQQEEKQK